MLEINITYFVIGFTVAAAPGAILIETIRRSLYDKSTVVGFTLGNFTGMALIIVAAFLGLTMIANNTSAQNTLYILGGMILVYMGLKAIHGKPKYHTVHKRVLSFKEEYTVFTLGFLLSVTNPIRILFWGSMVGGFLYESGRITNAIVDSLSIYAGMLSFYLIIISCLWHANSYIKQRHILSFSRLMGIVITGFGLSTLLKAVS